MNSAHVCKRFLVSGRVQGVFYRVSTLAIAEELQLVGYVRNLHAGGVEVVACGEKAMLENLHKWLWTGPQLAQVDEILDESIYNNESYVQFEVL